MSKTHKIAIVGIGAIAGMHARAIADIPNAQLVAGSCRTQEKGEKFTAEFGGNWYSNYVDMLDKEKPDFITIATPSGFHLEPVLAAAERGIHVLCEKPLEISNERVDQILTAAENAGITLGCIFPQRFNPVVRTLHDAAKAGRFGQLAVANAYVPWWRDDEYYAPSRWQGTLEMDGGGAMINQSIHAIDALQWIAATAGAGPVTEVFAFTGKCGHDPKLIEVEDTGVAALRFESGAMGLILATTAMYPGSMQRIHFGGRDGSVEIHEELLFNWQFRNETDEDQKIRDQYANKESITGGAGDPMAINYSNHTRTIEEFIEALEQNRKPFTDGHEARKSVAIIRAVYESAQTGQPVKPG